MTIPIIPPIQQEEVTHFSFFVWLLEVLLSGKTITASNVTDNQVDAIIPFLEDHRSLLTLSPMQRKRSVLNKSKEILIEASVKAIEAKGKYMPVVSETDTLRVYGDPHDVNKQVRYRYDEVHKQWVISYGKNVPNCLILNGHDGSSFVRIQEGKAKHIGSVCWKVEELAHTDIDEVSPAQREQACEKHFGTISISSFDPTKTEQYIARRNDILQATCNSTFGKYVMSHLKDVHQNPRNIFTMCAMPYQDQSGKWWGWLQDANANTIAVTKHHQEMALVVPKSLAISQQLFIDVCRIFRNNKGFCGADLTWLVTGQSPQFVKTGKVFSGNVVPITEVLQASDNDIAALVALAKDAEQHHEHNVVHPDVMMTKLSKKEAISNNASHTDSLAGVPTSMTSKGSKSQNHPDMQLSFKVTDVHGNEDFELHCSPYRENQAKDEDSNISPADVYVYKRKGHSFDERDHVVVIEKVPASENIPEHLRVIAGYKSGDPNSCVQAKISAQRGNIRQVVDIKVRQPENVPYADIPQDKTPSLFREAMTENLMCIQGCLGYYSDQGKKHIETGSMKPNAPGTAMEKAGLHTSQSAHLNSQMGVCS
tara:strand:- start:191 stop:1972 length:1782 start_codon:yes stop_codon:yes gene_type:complete